MEHQTKIVSLCFVLRSSLRFSLLRFSLLRSVFSRFVFLRVASLCYSCSPLRFASLRFASFCSISVRGRRVGGGMSRKNAHNFVLLKQKTQGLLRNTQEKCT